MGTIYLLSPFYPVIHNISYVIPHVSLKIVIGYFNFEHTSMLTLGSHASLKSVNLKKKS
jgi:hypothetical protein